MRRILAILVLASMLAVVSATVASTQEGSAGQGLEISPPLVEINADPGQTVNFDIRVRNITREVLLVTPQINDFVAQGEEGKPKLLLDNNQEPSPYSMKGWVVELAESKIAPQQQKTFNIALNVPADASPGGHYGVVRFTAVPPELEGTGVALSASVGSLVLVRVSGDIKEAASLVEFYTTQAGQRKSFFERGPITFTQRLRNDGNVHFKPIGTVRVTNLFGQEVGVLSVNEKGGNVLPASVRRFEQTLDNQWLFGRYSAEANIQYSGQNLSKTISFWVVPYRLLAIIFGTLLIVFVVVRQGLKRYIRRAVQKAESAERPKDK